MDRVAVACSGGRDSTALLHCTLKAARPLGVEVVALHVHHGLMPQADAWLAQVRGQSRRWGAAFSSRRLQDRPAPGDSVEAWARRERYRALAEMAHEADCPLVLLAHHRRDQAETWLLQALRSGGPRGLSAMPRSAQRQGLTWARPWLEMPRDWIDAYVQRHRLAHADDHSNHDPRFARSRLRLSVWPALLEAYPHAEVALAGAARQAQQAAALADEVAALDLPAVQDGAGLNVKRWCELPPARRRNALRAWLAMLPEAQAAGVPMSLVDRLLRELPGARGASRWPTPQGALRLQRGVLLPVAV
jgi:tRNA(Ile)-lysidine synthase